MSINADVVSTPLKLWDDAAVGDYPLAKPGLIPYAERIKLPVDGSNFGAQINAFITDCKTHSRTRGILSEGMPNIETPILMPSNFTLEGEGTPDTLNSAATYVGGVKLLQPTGGGDVIRCWGVDSGNNLSQMKINSVLRKITACARVGWTAAQQAGGPGRLFSYKSFVKATFEEVSANGYLAGHYYFENGWDSDFNAVKSLTSGGFSDMSVTADNSTVQGYTGRSFTPLELALSRSLGVPAVELFSPNTIGGDDTDNNLRFKDFHFESNATNSVMLFVHGGNCVMVTFDNGKIEAGEGNVPLIAVDQANSFRYLNSWLYAGASGSQPITVGGAIGGTAYNTKTTPAMVVLGSCMDPRIEASVGWSGGGNLFSFAWALTSTGSGLAPTDDPRIDLSIQSGLDKLTGRAVELSACTQVNREHIRVTILPYAAAVSGANTNKVAYNNATQVQGTPHTKVTRSVSGTTATDRPTLDDMGGIVRYTGSVPCTVTVDDLGAGQEIELSQSSTGAVITLVAGVKISDGTTAVTFRPTNAVLVSKGLGKTITLRSNGDGTVNVKNNGVPSGVKVYEYDGGTAGNTFTFTPNPDAILTEIDMQGPGGGSGAGARVLSTTGASGGAGGAAGARTKLRLSQAQMTAALTTLAASSVSLVLGAPGAAGVAAATDSTNGGDGGSAGESTFGTQAAFGQNWQAPGGGGGQGGRQGALSVGGSSSSPGPNAVPAVASSTTATSPTGRGLAGGAGVIAPSNSSILRIGGAGSGCSAVGVSASGGSSEGAGGGASGGGIGTDGSGHDGNQGGFGEGGWGGSAGTQSTPNAGAPTGQNSFTSGPGGGGGRGAASGQTAGNGSAGVNGSGAGGAGSTVNGQTAGAGAIGGNSWCRITEYYAENL